LSTSRDCAKSLAVRNDRQGARDRRPAPEDFHLRLLAASWELDEDDLAVPGLAELLEAPEFLKTRVAQLHGQAGVGQLPSRD